MNIIVLLIAYSPVLGPNGRLFNRVFDLANRSLKKTFGMELVELSTRANIIQDQGNADDELDEARKATGIRKKGIF